MCSCISWKLFLKFISFVNLCISPAPENGVQQRQWCSLKEKEEKDQFDEEQDKYKFFLFTLSFCIEQTLKWNKINLR